MNVLRTLGVLDARSPDGSALGSIVAQPKRAGVLCYLATARPPGWQPREPVIAMFWPELDEQHARNALNQAIHFLRRSLGADAILTRADELAVNRELVRCDAVELERCIESGSLEKALTLYQGDYLHGFHVTDAPDFEHWLHAQRERLRVLAGNAARELSKRCQSAGDVRGAIEFAKQSSTLAPFDEERLRTLLELMHEAGQPALAISFFDSFAQRLRDDLDLEPSAETRKAVERIRTSAAITSPPSAVAPPSVSAGSGSGTRDLDAQLRTELAPDLELMRPLGRGSMALAYLARDPGLKRLVTVKLLRPQLAGDSIARQRFEREGQAAARISHTNVATVYRVGRLGNGIPYLVNEYVAGRSLAETLSARGALPPEQAIPMLRAIASALAAAHAQGVIHRDLRPGNVFIENQTGRVVLTDFGIAALSDTGHEPRIQLTPLGQLLGDANYASPEQMRGDVITELSDVYAFGVVASETLNGRRPFDRSGADAASAAPRDADKHLIWSNGVSRETQELLERCLSDDAARRPRAADIVAML